MITFRPNHGGDRKKILLQKNFFWIYTIQTGIPRGQFCTGKLFCTIPYFALLEQAPSWCYPTAVFPQLWILAFLFAFHTCTVWAFCAWKACAMAKLLVIVTGVKWNIQTLTVPILIIGTSRSCPLNATSLLIRSTLSMGLGSSV